MIPLVRASGSGRGAFTLIELMAVTVILGMAMTVAAVGLSSRSASGQIEDAVSSLASIDAAARTLGRRGHIAAIRFDTRENAVLLIDRCCDDQQFASRAIAPSVSIEAWDLVSGQMIDLLVVDAQGRSRDYRVRFSNTSGARSMTFAGLTGWHQRSEVQR